MGRKKVSKQVAFYNHDHAETSTTRRYHANITQYKRSIQLEVHTVLPAVEPVDNNPRDNALFTDLQDDIPPEIIKHQLSGITVVARVEVPDRKRYESTVSSFFYL